MLLLLVTCIHDACEALKLLSEKKNEYDLLLVDREITKLDIHTFLRSADIKELLSMGEFLVALLSNSYFNF